MRAPAGSAAADRHDVIRVHGARENNLKDVSVELPVADVVRRYVNLPGRTRDFRGQGTSVLVRPFLGYSRFHPVRATTSQEKVCPTSVCPGTDAADCGAPIMHIMSSAG